MARFGFGWALTDRPRPDWLRDLLRLDPVERLEERRAPAERLRDLPPRWDLDAGRLDLDDPLDFEAGRRDFEAGRRDFEAGRRDFEAGRRAFELDDRALLLLLLFLEPDATMFEVCE